MSDPVVRLLIVFVLTVVVAIIAYDQGIKAQKAAECEALGGQKIENVCVKGTEIVRRW